MTKLNLGCGSRKIEGFTNVDSNLLFNPDLVHDLNKPLPFKDNSVSEIRMEMVLSYLDDINLMFREIYRVSKNRAKVTVLVPHFSFGFVDPNHKRGFSYGFLNFVHDYTSTKFRVDTIRFSWMRSNTNMNFILRALNSVISFFANLHKGLCERLWCYWVGGFEELLFELTVIK